MLVVFEVLPKLELGRVFQPWLEPGQRGIEIQLLRRTRRTVSQRQIGRLVSRDTEADADDFRLQRVQAGGFGINGSYLGGIQLGQSLIQLCAGENGHILPLGHGTKIKAALHTALGLACSRAGRHAGIALQGGVLNLA